MKAEHLPDFINLREGIRFSGYPHFKEFSFRILLQVPHQTSYSRQRERELSQPGNRPVSSHRQRAGLLVKATYLTGRI